MAFYKPTSLQTGAQIHVCVPIAVEQQVCGLSVEGMLVEPAEPQRTQCIFHLNTTVYLDTAHKLRGHMQPSFGKLILLGKKAK